MAIESAEGLEDELEGKGADTPKGKRKLLVLIVAGVLVLTGAGGAGLFFSGILSGEAQDNAADEATALPSTAPPIYFSLDPAITVNFQRGQRTRFLQVSISVMAREQEAIEHLQRHMPVVRNNLNLLFSSQDYEVVSTREGKEALRQAALTEIRNILAERAGEPGVEEVYFTGFVMQ